MRTSRPEGEGAPREAGAQTHRTSRSVTAGSWLLALLLSSGHLAAQGWEAFDYEDLELRGIGVEAGRAWPARVAPTSVYVVRADLGFLGPRVRAVPSIRFWASSLRTEEVERLAEQIVLVCERQGDAVCPERLDLGEVRLSDLELAADAHYLFFPTRRLSAYLGFSAGLHLLNGRGDFIDDTFVEDLLDTVSPGVGPLLGINLQLGSRLRLGLEGRLMLGSDIRYAALGAGGLWTLPVPNPDPNP